MNEETWLTVALARIEEEKETAHHVSGATYNAAF
jgi:hypothetical protein